MTARESKTALTCKSPLYTPASRLRRRSLQTTNAYSSVAPRKYSNRWQEWHSPQSISMTLSSSSPKRKRFSVSVCASSRSLSLFLSLALARSLSLSLFLSLPLSLARSLFLCSLRACKAWSASSSACSAPSASNSRRRRARLRLRHQWQIAFGQLFTKHALMPATAAPQQPTRSASRASNSRRPLAPPMFFDMGT